MVSVVASLISAGVALPLIRFRRGKELKVTSLLKGIASWSPRRLELEVINVKMTLVEDGERWMRGRSRLLFASLTMLATAVALTALRVIFT